MKGKEKLYLTRHRKFSWVGPRASLEGCRKISPPPGFNPRTIQPVATHYTDYAIQAPGIYVPFKIVYTLEYLNCERAEGCAVGAHKIVGHLFLCRNKFQLSWFVNSGTILHGINRRENTWLLHTG
jgi:hypothetical protein